MPHSKEDVRKATLEYFEGDVLPTDAWMNKYALKNERDEFMELTPDDTHKRISRCFSSVESKYPNPVPEDVIYEALKGFKRIIVQGSPMSGIGNTYQVQSLSNCFVVSSPEDSYGGILKTDEEMCQVLKRRGGVGMDITNIRPKGLRTANSARTTDGIGVFMMRYSNSCREAAQGGRRGALLMSCDVRHPEIDTFITIKRDPRMVTGANVSTKIPDSFMQAVVDGKSYEQRWPVKSSIPQLIREVDAREQWKKIVSSAWEFADPGVMFSDTIERYTISDAYAPLGYKSITCNPCGEIQLPEKGSCILALLNISSYVSKPFTSEAELDVVAIDKYAMLCARLLDDLVDLELDAIDRIIAKIDSDPESEDVKLREKNLWLSIRQKTHDSRRVGLGVTGVGDAIAMLGLKYGSRESISIVSKIYKTIAVASYKESCILAGERGTFPIFDRKLEETHPFLQRLIEESEELRELYEKNGRRNIANLTTAPAGTVSVCARTTSGIEPLLFMNEVRKRKLYEYETDVSVDYVDEVGDRWHNYERSHYGIELWKKVTGKTDVKESPYHGSTCEDIDWIASVDLQAAAQHYIDHSVSKTVNLPSTATVEDVERVYMRAWKSGCKGITVYRASTKDAVIKDASSVSEDSESLQPQTIVESHAPRRPKTLDCDVHKCSIKGEAWTIIVGLFDGKPYEVFGGLSKYVEIPRKIKKGAIVKNGKKDGISTYNLEFGEDDSKFIIKDVVNTFDNPLYGAHTRTLSLSLRHGIPIQYIVESLVRDKTSDMTSFSRVIARVLKGYIPDGTKVNDDVKKCPDCGSKLVYQSGCVACSSCTWSKCG